MDLVQYFPPVQGDVLPEPLNTLCQQASSMQAWPLPGNGRWLALAIAQEDKELPVELLAAVGEASAYMDWEAGQRKRAEHPDTLIVRGNLARWTGEAGDAG